MAVPVTSSIVSYGGAATSAFLATPTPFSTYNFASNLVGDRLNKCAHGRVSRIKNLLQQHEDGIKEYKEEHRKGALFCRSGTWLEMIPSAYDDTIQIHGTKDENSIFSIVEFISVAMSLVSIRGVETKHFICMDPTGKLYATPSSNYSTECVFFEEMMENYYNLYSSCEYGNRSNPWYIEFRRSGKSRRGPNTKKRRKASHFLVVHHDLNRLRRPGQPNGNDVTDLVVASLLHSPPSHPLFRSSGYTTKQPYHSHRISKLRAKVELANPSDNERMMRENEEKRRRREKKKRRREDRLMKEEKRRRERKQELNDLRAQELRRSRPNRYEYRTYAVATTTTTTIQPIRNVLPTRRSYYDNTRYQPPSPDRPIHPPSPTRNVYQRYQ